MREAPQDGDSDRVSGDHLSDGSFENLLEASGRGRGEALI